MSASISVEVLEEKRVEVLAKEAQAHKEAKYHHEQCAAQLKLANQYASESLTLYRAIAAVKAAKA